MSKICSCFGKAKNLNKNGLEESLYVFYEYLINEQNFDVFCFGGIGEFDELCFKVVKKLQSEHEQIKTVLVSPKFKNKECGFETEIVERFDECITLGGEDFERLPILSRNFEMAKSSSFIIFFASEKGRGNETQVLNFAKEKNIPHTNFY